MGMVGQEERGGDAIGCFIIYRNQLRRHLPFWCVFWCARAHTHTRGTINGQMVQRTGWINGEGAEKNQSLFTFIVSCLLS